jgi:hypothetical protein
MQNTLTRTETWPYTEHVNLLHDSGRSDLAGLEERNGRLQSLVGELLRKNQELRFEVAHLQTEDQRIVSVPLAESALHIKPLLT